MQHAACPACPSGQRGLAESHEAGGGGRSSARARAVMYDPQSRSRRYLNDMIYMERPHWRSRGTGGSQAWETPLLLPLRGEKCFQTQHAIIL